MRKIFFLLIFIVSAHAFDKRPPCYLDLERNFFNMGAVIQAMSMQMVPQGQWDPIVRSLTEAQRALPSIVEDRARRLPRNPFYPEFVPDVAKDLLISSAFEIFNRVVYFNGFTNTVSIRTMFDYAISQDARFNYCFPQKKPQPAPAR